MKIVCAWCGKVLREDSVEEIFHVICRECYDREACPFIEAQAEAKAGKAFKPPPPEFDFLHRQMFFILILGSLFLLFALANLVLAKSPWLTSCWPRGTLGRNPPMMTENGENRLDFVPPKPELLLKTARF